MPRNTVGNLHKKPLGRHFIAEWRQHRGLTQPQLAERIGTTKATISRVESYKQPYSQKLLEVLSEELNCEPADLIMRDPTNSQAPWSIWEHAKEGERKQIIGMMKLIVDKGTGTDG